MNYIPRQVLTTIYEDRLRTAARDQHVAALRREQAASWQEAAPAEARSRRALNRRVTRAFGRRAVVNAAA
jgi:hypothetical protein